MLGFEPAEPESAHRSATGENVERGDDLAEVGDVAIGDAGHQGSELHPFGHRSEERQCCVALEHVAPGRSEHRYLTEMVHHPDAREPGRLGARGGRLQPAPDGRRSARPCVHWQLQPEAKSDR